MNPLVWIGLVIFVVVLAILLEGRRQTRRLREKGEAEPVGRGNLLGGGALELQSMLQPDRKVEVLKMQVKEGEITAVRGDAESGDDPESGDHNPENGGDASESDDEPRR